MTYAFVWGRTPLLSRAELLHVLRVWGYSHREVASGRDFLILEFEADPTPLFPRLGGVVKVVQIMDEPPLDALPEGKLSFGVSLYGGGDRRLRKDLQIRLKQRLREMGRNSRFVHTDELALSSGTVTREQLLTKGFEWNRFTASGETYEGRTVWVQDIEAWAARDQERPFRDPRVGMLPPKLARILVNLAVMSTPEAAAGPVYDPFVGTGTVLQEALMSGYEAAGADLDPRMVDYTIGNVSWLAERAGPFHGHLRVKQQAADVAPTFALEAVATEGYLGPPRTKPPQRPEYRRLAAQVRELYDGALGAVQGKLAAGKRAVVCLPTFDPLPRFDFVDSLGAGLYNLVGTYDYRRDDQVVGRQIAIYERKD